MRVASALTAAHCDKSQSTKESYLRASATKVATASITIITIAHSMAF